MIWARSLISASSVRGCASSRARSASTTSRGKTGAPYHSMESPPVCCIGHSGVVMTVLLLLSFPKLPFVLVGSLLLKLHTGLQPSELCVYVLRDNKWSDTPGTRLNYIPAFLCVGMVMASVNNLLLQLQRYRCLLSQVVFFLLLSWRCPVFCARWEEEALLVGSSGVCRFDKGFLLFILLISCCSSVQGVHEPNDLQEEDVLHPPTCH